MKSQDTFAQINNVSLVILATVALTVSLIYTKAIMIPFVFAVFLYAVASPVDGYCRKRMRLPRAVSIVMTFVVIALFITLISLTVTNSLDGFFKSTATYREKLLQVTTTAAAKLDNWGIEVNRAALQKSVRDLPVLSMARDLTGGVVAFVGNTFLVFIIFLFLMAGSGAVQPNRRKTGAYKIWTEIQGKVSRYVATKFATSLLTAVLVTTILALFSVDLAVMFGVLTFLLNFIPSVGSIIATALPVPILLLQFGLAWQALVITALCGAVQFVIGSLMEPKMIGESLDLHPVTVLLFLMFWGLVWGIPGMFLAVPITSVLKIALSRVQTTRGIAELLAGRLPG